MNVHDLPTPALVIDHDLLLHNLQVMTSTRPGPMLRPHVKAHKCTALAAEQARVGHHSFTCATTREVLGMAAAGLGDDLLLANEVVHPDLLGALTAAQDTARITVAVDSPATVEAAARAGLREVLVDVEVGLPRCGCRVEDAGRVADFARARGMTVRGVMGYEGHLMMVEGRAHQAAEVQLCVDRLLRAHHDVGGEVVSAGGTGTYQFHDRVSEVQAGSYALMDSDYARLGLPFAQACWVIGTVVSTNGQWAVADVGLKALAMDHGNPSIAADAGGGSGGGGGGEVWFFSDEHVTFAPHAAPATVGDRIRIVPAHIDPTMAKHEVAWVVRGEEVLEQWAIDLRGW